MTPTATVSCAEEKNLETHSRAIATLGPKEQLYNGNTYQYAQQFNHGKSYQYVFKQLLCGILLRNIYSME